MPPFRAFRIAATPAGSVWIRGWTVPIKAGRAAAGARWPGPLSSIRPSRFSRNGRVAFRLDARVDMIPSPVGDLLHVHRIIAQGRMRYEPDILRRRTPVRWVG